MSVTAKTLFGELLEGELAPIGQRIARVFYGVLAAQRNLDKKRKGLEAIIEEYRKARPALFQRKLEEAGMAWCTRHRGVVPAGEVQPIYVEREGRACCLCGKSHGWIREIHWCCPGCREEVRSSASSGRGALRVAIDVEEDGFGILAWSGGRALPEDTRVRGRFPLEIPPDVAEEWGLPPDVFLDRDSLELKELNRP